MFFGCTARFEDAEGPPGDFGSGGGRHTHRGLAGPAPWQGCLDLVGERRCDFD